MPDPKNRECGSCTMCCKVMSVPELEKPPNRWCSHCEVGKGCTVYHTRPESCRAFECLWLTGHMPEDVRPDKSRVVVGMTTDGRTPVLYVDPHRPDAWQVPTFRALITKMRNAGLKTIIVCGDKRTMLG